jgi:glycosyltransferase involved in cell wall biosynthesis
MKKRNMGVNSLKKIALDLRILNNGVHATGIEKYAFNLTREIIKYNSEQYVLLGEGMEQRFDSSWMPSTEVNHNDKADKLISLMLSNNLPLSNNKMANRLLSLTGFINEFDLQFSPYYPIPERRQYKGVLTIHDMIPLRCPEWFSSDKVHHYFDKELRESANSCDHIIADSQSTKNDIIDFYNINPDKISVVYLAANQLNVNDDNKSWLDPGINRNASYYPYILSVCTIEPRKNLMRTIDAYELIRDRYPNCKINLILTGRFGWNYDDLLRRTQESLYCENIILTDYVPDQQLPTLYKNAECFVYPSLYEGFGLPVLEAMQMGVPVVTSNVSSLPEVGGDSVAYCDPYSVESIADSMAKVLFSSSLQQELRKKGQERSKLFSWENTARQTRDIFLKCLSQ